MPAPTVAVVGGGILGGSHPDLPIYPVDMTGDGFLSIQGRADDTIVLDNGRKVIVRPIEERLQAHPAIEDCADEQIARVVIAQTRFSIENGLLTSQFKPRHKEIFQACRDRITGAAAQPEPSPRQRV